MKKIEKLEKMPYAQASIIRENKKIALKSYATIVIEINTESGWTRCYGTYSQTTRKHISAFCEQFGSGLNYQLMKEIYINNTQYNVYTGEIMAL